MTQMMKPLISTPKERGDAVWKVIPIMTTVWACVVKDAGVGPLSVGIAVFIKGVTSTISAVKKRSTVPTVSRHLFIPSVVLHLVAIPNAWAEVFGARGDDMCDLLSYSLVTELLRENLFLKVG